MSTFYHQCVPIETRPCSAWTVDYGDHKELELWSAEASIDEVVRAVAVHHPGAGFTVMRQDVGIFVIKEVVTAYSGDGRKVSNDFEVVL